ncbi:MAG: hypothetical protein ACYCVD_12565 [Desulfitobacteriaceae bacterium]
MESLLLDNGIALDTNLLKIEGKVVTVQDFLDVLKRRGTTANVKSNIERHYGTRFGNINAVKVYLTGVASRVIMAENTSHKQGKH